MGAIGYLEICGYLVGSDEAVSEAFAAASMPGLCHNVRHNDWRGLGRSPKVSDGGQALGRKTPEGLFCFHTYV